jgi:flagellar motor switch protein FliG
VTPAVTGRDSKFTDLAMLDDNSLRELFAQFDSEHWAVALRGADEPLIAKLVHALAMGDAQQLAAARSALGPVRLGDVDVAQRAIAERLGPLRYRGRALPPRVTPPTPGFEEPA